MLSARAESEVVRIYTANLMITCGSHMLSTIKRVSCMLCAEPAHIVVLYSKIAGTKNPFSS